MRHGGVMLANIEDGGFIGTVIAEELYDHERGSAHGPERALMSALLFDGIMTCLNYAGTTSAGCRGKYKEAIQWVLTPGSEYVFAFDNVCDCLGINPDKLRIGLINACNSRTGGEKKGRRTF